MPSNPDSSSALIILIVLGIVAAIVGIADLIIFVRWIRYLWAKYDLEERRIRNAALLAQSPAYAAEQPAMTDPTARAPSELPWDGVPAHVIETPLPESPGSGQQPEMTWDLGETVFPLETQPIEAQLVEAQPALVSTAPHESALDPEMPKPPFARTWSLVDPFLGFQVVFIVSQVVITLALLPVLFSHGLNHAQEMIFSPAGIVIQSIGLFFMNALFIGVVAFYLRRYRSSFPEIGLGTPNARQISLGIGLGLLLLAVASGAEFALGNVLPHLLPKAVLEGMKQLTNETTAGGMFGKIQSIQLKIFFALAGAVAAPVGEEIFFRGLLYNALKRRLNVPAAIVISGLLFALVHFGPLAILVIFPMGMMLAYVYEKTRSLWVTIMMHATNNGLAFVLALAFPQLGETPKTQPKPAAPPKPALILTLHNAAARHPNEVFSLAAHERKHKGDR